MANRIRNHRPFDNFRVAISDPHYFVGRRDLLDAIRWSPFQVRVLLGGRRLGKTSTLRATEWVLLTANPGRSNSAFPVFVSLQFEQPTSLDHLRYLMIMRLREVMDRWQQVQAVPQPQMYLRFLAQVADNEVTSGFFAKLGIQVNHERSGRLSKDQFRRALLETNEELRRWEGTPFQGVCFLVDEAEFLVCQDWADDAGSYFRGLKDTDTALKPFFGLILSGYRNLKQYQQRVGSPLLNISDVEWLGVLSEEEARELIAIRSLEEQVPLDDKQIDVILQEAGCHPYLCQQKLNIVFDNYASIRKRSFDGLKRDFAAWWNVDQLSDGFSDAERTVYHALVMERRSTVEILADHCGLSRNKVLDALEVLAGTGVIRQLDEDYFMIGARLFERWVAQESGSEHTLICPSQHNVDIVFYPEPTIANSLVGFTWLHLTDLHLGMAGLSDLWPNVEEDFFNDLEFLCNKVGPLDLVLFTGDLVQRGAAAEFEQVNRLLERFWTRFNSLGFEPQLLAVPGNHDLVRPANPQDPAFVTLMRVWGDSSVQAPFWTRAQSAQRKLVNKAFTNYVDWWKSVPVPKPRTYLLGMLPGDFSATFEKQGVTLGVVGLNSTFLQLTGGDLQGKLAVGIQQFHQACGGNGPQWVEKHTAALLLTHQPPDWLTKEAQGLLNGEIHHPPHRFALHLFGHMHEANLSVLNQGGASPRRQLQGCSLFGMEGWGVESTERIHGYSLGQVRIDGDAAELQIWPRRAMRKQGGGWQIDRDPSFDLPRGEDGTEPMPLKLLSHHRSKKSQT